MRPDIQAVFDEDYIPPWMRWNCDELPPKPKPRSWYIEQLRVRPYKPRRRRWGKTWNDQLLYWVLDDCSLPYQGTGKPMTPTFTVPEVKKNRW